MRVRIAIATFVIAFAAGLVGLAVSGLTAASLRDRFEREAARALGRTVSIARVGGDPFRGVVLEGVRIASHPGAAEPLLAIPRLVIRPSLLQLTADLLRGRGVGPSLRVIEAHRPRLVVVRDAQGHWNHADLLSRASATGAPAFVGQVEVREGTLVFTDAYRVRTPFTAHFERVTGVMTVDRVQTVRVEADAVNSDGRTPALLHITGVFRNADASADIELTTRGAALPHWGAYLFRPRWLGFAGGTVDGSVHLLFSRWGAGTALDYRGGLTVRNGRVVLQPLGTVIADIEGPLRVDNLKMATEGLAMTVAGSPVWVRGQVLHAAGAQLDLAVRAPALDLRTLRGLLAPDLEVTLVGQASGDVRITGRAASLRLDGTLVDARGAVDGYPFADGSAAFQYAGGLLVVDRFSADAAGGRIRGHVRVGVADRSVVAVASAEQVEAGVLAGPGRRTPLLRGRADGFVAVAATPGTVTAQGRFSSGPGSIYGVAFDRAGVALAYDRGRVELDQLEIHAGPALLRAAGAIDADGALGVDVIATDLDLKAVGAVTGLSRWLAGTADTAGRIGGTIQTPVFTGDVEAWAGQLGPFPFDLARGSVHLSPTWLQTPGLMLQDGDGTFEARGEVRWSGRGLLDMAIRAQDVPAQRLLDIAKVPVDISGSVRGDVRLSGELVAPRAAGTITLTRGSVQGQRVDRATAAFRWTGSALVLDEATAEVNSSRVVGRGVVDDRGRLEIVFAATGLDLRDIGVARTAFVDASGVVDLRGTIGGTVPQPSVVTTVSSQTLALNGQSFDRAEGAVRYQRGRLALSPLLLHQGDGSLRLAGTLLLQPDPVIDLRASAEQTALSTLLGLARVTTPFALDGRVNGDFVASGRVSNPGGVLAFEVTGARLGDHPIRHAAVNAAFADHTVTLRTLTMTPVQGTLVAAGRIDLDGTSEVEISGQGLSLDILRPFLGLSRPLTGALEFTLQATGTLADPLLGLSASASRIGEAAIDRAILQAYYQDGTLYIEQGLVQEERHKVKADGSVPVQLGRVRVDPARPLNLRLALVDADLSLLPQLTGWIPRATGALAGEIRVTGLVTRPRLEGTLSIRDGVVQIRGIDPSVEDLQAQIVLARDEVRIERVAARLGAGSVSLAGTIGLGRLRPDVYRLTLEARDVPIHYAPVFNGVADGTLQLAGPASRPTFGGTLRLSRGELVVPSFARPDRAAARGGVDPVLDLTLQAGEGLWANVGRLRVQVQGGVRASGSVRRPVLAGEVTAERGQFTAFNTQFTLTAGTATFAEFRGTTPVIDAQAQTQFQQVSTVGDETRLETVSVYLHVSGTPDALSLDLASDPALSREELLAGLAGRVGFTRLLSGEEVETVLQAEVSAAVFGTVGQAVARELDLEEFTITYDFVRPLQLRIGKILVRNLYVTLTSEFGVSARNIWSLEYRFTPAHSVSFSVDDQGEYELLYRYTLRF